MIKIIEEKEKTIRITISLRKTLNADIGVSVRERRYFETNYDGKLSKETIEILLEKTKNRIIDMEKKIDKKKE